MKTKTYIYALKDPVTHKIRYVGKADNPVDRFYTHLADKRLNHRTCWIKSLKNKGLRPVLETLAVVKKEEWVFWEKYYISIHSNLVNGTLGGDGLTATAVVKDKISKSHSKRQVVQYNLNGDFLAIYRNTNKAFIKTGVCRTTIQKVCGRKNKTGGNFFWKWHIKGDEIQKKVTVTLPHLKGRAYNLGTHSRKGATPWNKGNKQGLLKQ